MRLPYVAKSQFAHIYIEIEAKTMSCWIATLGQSKLQLDSGLNNVRISQKQINVILGIKLKQEKLSNSRKDQDKHNFEKHKF